MSKPRKTSTDKESTLREVAKAVSENLVRPDDQVAVAAYFKAQKRQFQPGRELDDWVEAEEELATHSK